MQTYIKLISYEGLALEIEKEAAMKIKLISDSVETGVIEIPLPNVKLNVLKKVMQYCEMHKDDNPPEIVKPLRSTNMAEIVDQKDADFIDIENLEELFDIVRAANDLDIKSLLELSCAKLATFIKNKTPEEIRKTFNIKNDNDLNVQQKFSQEEENNDND